MQEDKVEVIQTVIPTVDGMMVQEVHIKKPGVITKDGITVGIVHLVEEEEAPILL